MNASILRRLIRLKARATGALFAVALAANLSMPAPLRASVPAIFNYQGKLADAAGNPVTNAAPGVPMVFRIYDAPAPGGALLSTYTPANPVPVTNGVFNVLIGDPGAGSFLGFPLDLALSGPGDRYLEVVVNGTALAPRERLAAAPYALSVADGSVGNAQLGSGAVTDDKVSDVSWAKLTGVPAGFADGMDNAMITIRKDGGFVVLSSTMDFLSPLTVTTSGGWAHVGVSASSVTLMGNVFNGPDLLMRLNGAAVAPVSMGGTGATSTTTARAGMEAAWSGVRVLPAAAGGLAGGGPLTGDVTLGLDTAGFTPCDTSGVTGKTYWDGAKLVCWTDNAGQGGTVTGTGAINALTKWTTTGGALGDSNISDNGSGVSVGTGMTVTGALSATGFSGNGAGVTNVDAGSFGGLGPSLYAPASHTHGAGDIVSGTLGVARGGTGLSSLAANSYLRAAGAAAFDLRTYAQVRGDIVAASSGTNSDITSLSGLTPPLPVVENTTGGGGTGAGDAFTARLNLGAAASGANNDITRLTGLTTPLSVTQGGTGAISSATARTNLGLGLLASSDTISNGSWSGTPLSVTNGGTGAANAAAARAGLVAASSGTNSDITSLTGLTTPLPPSEGGTGIGSYAGPGNYIDAFDPATLQERTPSQMLSDIGAASSGANADITGLSGLTTPLSVTQGGTGAISSATARTNLGLGALSSTDTINNGSWSGAALALAKGGTGATTAAGARTAIGLGIGAACSGVAPKLLWDGTQFTCGTDAGSSGTVGGNGTGGKLPRWSGAGASTNLTDSILSDNGSTVTVSGNLSVSGNVSGTWTGAAVALAQGGTGAVSSATARTSLGLGLLATTDTISNASWSGAPLSVANGGTGSGTLGGAGGVWANLGLGALASTDTINDGTWLGTPLAVLRGGTGASNAAGARANLGLLSLASTDTINNASWSGTALVLGNGGTGAINPGAARTILGAAVSGPNGDITSFGGAFTVALSTAQGGTGGTTPALARTGLVAASSGTNSDITSLGLAFTVALSTAEGGTGGNTIPTARASLVAASSGTNSDITSLAFAVALSTPQGGTAATTAAGARTNLGLKALATLNPPTLTPAEITNDQVWPVNIGPGAANQFLTTTNGGAPTSQWTTLGGNSTMTVSGTNINLTIVNGAVTGTMIAASTITDANISNTAAIAYGKLNLANSIVNADIAAGAAIAAGKLVGVVTGVSAGNSGLSVGGTAKDPIVSANPGATCNDLTWTAGAAFACGTAVGTVTSVGTNATLTGGGFTTTGTLAIAPGHANTWSAAQAVNEWVYSTELDVTGGATWKFHDDGAGKLILEDGGPSPVTGFNVNGGGVMDFPNGLRLAGNLNAGYAGFGPSASTSFDATIEVNGSVAGIAFQNRSFGGTRWVEYVRSAQYALWNDAAGDVFVVTEDGLVYTQAGGWTAKTFVINHPVDPSKYLVHATLEGPEASVYYRGTARLADGKAEVSLPAYFEALTRPEGRTVILTAVDGFDPIVVKRVDGRQIKDGKFLVVSSDPKSAQEFNWKVTAVRKDIAPLAVEPAKSDVEVAGDGPYTYIKGWKK